MSGDIDMRPIHELTTEEVANELARRSRTVAAIWIDQTNDQVAHLVGGSPISAIGLGELLSIRLSHMAHDLAQPEDDDDGD